MKLPEKHPALRFMPGGLNELEQRLTESIVRDCAKVAGDMVKLECDGYDRNGHEKAILARYGLGSK